MVETYGSDKNATDLTRVLRAPGFCHMKNPENPHLAKIVHHSGAERHTRSEVKGHFPPVEKDIDIPVMQRKVKGIADQPLCNGVVNTVSDDQMTDLAEALKYIPLDDRDVWIKVGLALKSLGNESLRALWEFQSSKSAKYDFKASYEWDRLNPDGSITYAYVFKLAADHGWRNPKKIHSNVCNEWELLRELSAVGRYEEMKENLENGVFRKNYGLIQAQEASPWYEIVLFQAFHAP